MHLHGDGALGVWHGIVGEHQREAEDWYNREHHAERVAISGFLRARRYVNRGAGPRYFSRYDVTNAGVLAGPAYLEALNAPSLWSRKIFPHYRNTVRGAFSVAARAGDAEGGYLTSLRFGDGASGGDQELVRALCDVAGRLTAEIGVLSVEVWQIDASATTPPTREKELRATNEPFPAAALLIDTSGPEHGAQALANAAPAGLPGRAAVDVLKLVFQKFARNAR